MLPSTLTPSELAEYWNCSRRTVLNLVYSGQLKSFSLSSPDAQKKHHRIKANDVINYMERGDFPSKKLQNKIINKDL